MSFNREAFDSHHIADGCVNCPLKGRSAALSECASCTRGFIVRFEGEPRYVLCPTNRNVAVVGDIMSRKALSVRPDLPIENLILLLVDEDISAVPVVDENHRPIGMASKSDLVFDDYEWAELRDEALSLRRVAAQDTEADLHVTELLQSHKVRDIMSGDPVVVTTRTRIIEAARLMAKNHVHGCPVVDDDGRFVAMVTALDVVRWVAADEG
ncbi:MAG: CBS domain-containing protein [Archangiaceae bacterium]|nr:CBS domain-containing protein [Archangiaceae bacterium]